VFPAERGTDVPSDGFTALQEAIPDTEAMRLTIEEEETGIVLVVDLPAGATASTYLPLF